MVECLSSMNKALGSIPGTKEMEEGREGRRREEQEWMQSE